MGDPQAPAPPRRRHRPRSHGGGEKLIAWFNKRGPDKFETEEGLVGGSAYEAHKVAVTDETMAKAMAADAVIFGAVGGPKWDAVRLTTCVRKPACCAYARISRFLRQPSPRRDLSGIGRRLLA